MQYVYSYAFLCLLFLNAKKSVKTLLVASKSIVRGVDPFVQQRPNNVRMSLVSTLLHLTFYSNWWFNHSIIFCSTDGCWQYDGLKFKKKTGRWWKKLITSCVIFDCCSMTQNKGYCTLSCTIWKFVLYWKPASLILRTQLEPRSGELHSIQHYVIKFASDLLQVGGFSRVLCVPPPIKFTVTI